MHLFQSESLTWKGEGRYFSIPVTVAVWPYRHTDGHIIGEISIFDRLTFSKLTGMRRKELVENRFYSDIVKQDPDVLFEIARAFVEPSDLSVLSSSPLGR